VVPIFGLKERGADRRTDGPFRESLVTYLSLAYFKAALKYYYVAYY